MMPGASTSPADQQAVARVRGRREHWVELQPGISVLLRRPAETAFGGFFRPSSDGTTTDIVTDLADAQACVVGWRGVTSATAYGADGGNDPLEFSNPLWAELVADNADWSQIVARELAQLIVAYIKSKAEAAKN